MGKKGWCYMSQDTTCISFVNSKGGTGKTTSCLSIAGCLAKDGNKVLVVDFDPRADAKNKWEIFHPETDAFRSKT